MYTHVAIKLHCHLLTTYQASWQLCRATFFQLAVLTMLQFSHTAAGWRMHEIIQFTRNKPKKISQRVPAVCENKRENTK